MSILKQKQDNIDDLEMQEIEKHTSSFGTWFSYPFDSYDQWIVILLAEDYFPQEEAKIIVNDLGEKIDEISFDTENENELSQENKKVLEEEIVLICEKYKNFDAKEVQVEAKVENMGNFMEKGEKFEIEETEEPPPVMKTAAQLYTVKHRDLEEKNKAKRRKTIIITLAVILVIFLLFLLIVFS
jgi:hypothetical protein